jgi:hypothetical protein
MQEREGKKQTRKEGNAKAQRRKDAKGKKRKEKKGIRKEEEEEELGRRCPKREKAASIATNTYQLKVHPEPTNFSSISPPPTLPYPTLPFPNLFPLPSSLCVLAPLRLCVPFFFFPRSRVPSLHGLFPHLLEE